LPASDFINGYQRSVPGAPAKDMIYFCQDHVTHKTTSHLCTASFRWKEIRPFKPEKNKTMDIPVWAKPAAWGAIAGAIVMSTVGFSQLGWVTANTADHQAQDRADTAVVSALVPFCVIKAQQDPDLTVLTKFKAETSSYSRGDIVSKAGWATVGSSKTPDNALARACSDTLHTMKTS